jgi:hypothetical protein
VGQLILRSDASTWNISVTHRSQCAAPGHRLRQFRSHQIASRGWCECQATCRR